MEQAQKVAKGMKIAASRRSNEDKKQTEIDTWNGNVDFGKAAMPSTPVPREIEFYTKDSLKYNIKEYQKEITKLIQLKRNASKEKIAEIEQAIKEIKERIRFYQKKLKDL